jgi:hypothetical protein
MKTYQLFDGEKYLSSGKKWSNRTRKIRIAQDMLLALYNQAEHWFFAAYYANDRQKYRDVRSIRDNNTRLRYYVATLPETWKVIADSGEEYTPLEFFDAYKRGDLK